MRVPSVPKSRKIIAKYRSDEWVNVVCITKTAKENKIEFYLWDGHSKSYTHIIQFDLLK